MEGVGIVSNDGHVLLHRTRENTTLPSSQLLTLFAAGKFAQDQAECQTLSSKSDQKRVNMIVKDNFTIICWFSAMVDECVARRLAEYVYDQLMMILGSGTESFMQINNILNQLR